MGDQWEISMGNGVVITNRICKACTVELCDRKLKANMFVLDTRGYDVILEITWLSKYHAVIDYQNKKVIFRISHQPEFQFIEERKSLRKEDQLDCATAEDKKKTILVWNEFLETELWSSPLTLFQERLPSLKHCTGWHQQNWQY